MKILFALVASVALLAGCADTETRTAEPAKPSGHEQSVVEVRAVVTGVDQPRRLLAIEADDGAKAVLPIAAEFRDFDKLHVGDHVVVSYTEAIAWQVKRSQDGAPGLSATEALLNPKPGAAPGGSIERAITLTATITALDTPHQMVTLTGPEGVSQTLKVKNAADLEHVAVGDLVDITYTETRALAVRPADKP